MKLKKGIRFTLITIIEVLSIIIIIKANTNITENMRILLILIMLIGWNANLYLQD